MKNEEILLNSKFKHIRGNSEMLRILNEARADEREKMSKDDEILLIHNVEYCKQRIVKEIFAELDKIIILEKSRMNFESLIDEVEYEKLKQKYLKMKS